MFQVDTREVRPSGTTTLQLVILFLATAILLVDLALTLRLADLGTEGTSAVNATTTAEPYLPTLVRPVEPTIAPGPIATPYIPAFLLPVDDTGS
jgi:hypothetical protein